MEATDRQLYHRAMRRSLFLLAMLVPVGSLADLPGSFIEIPDNVTTVLVAETGTSTLHRFTRVDGMLRRAESSYMSIGENGVGKERAWDRRTPLGIYFINDRLDTSRMHDRYGVLALPLDYPNAWDLRRERTGDGIWLHGVDPNGGKRPPLDTDGCLALPNDDLLALDPYVQMLVTPVIITRELDFIPEEARGEIREKLLESMEQWSDSFRDGRWQAYFELYAEDFSFRGLPRDRWQAYRIGAAATRPLEDFMIDDVIVLADPEEPDLFLSRFRQSITDAQGTIRTTKRLYWRREADGSFRIVAEDNG